MKDKISKFVNKLKSTNFVIPYVCISSCRPIELRENFFDSDFRFLKNEIPNLADELKGYPIRKQVEFWNFAYAFGCLSHDKVLDKNGSPTDVYVAQKASSALAKGILFVATTPLTSDCEPHAQSSMTKV